MKCSKCHREIVETDDAAYGLDGSVYHNECPPDLDREFVSAMIKEIDDYIMNEFPPSQSPKRAEPK